MTRMCVCERVRERRGGGGGTKMPIKNFTSVNSYKVITFVTSMIFASCAILLVVHGQSINKTN